MSAELFTGTEPPVTTVSRLGAVLRMNLVGTPARLAGPWLLVTAILVINLAIFWVAGANGGDAGPGTTGALFALPCVAGSLYLVMMTQVMPFALSLGITRKHYYAGVCVLLLGESLVHAVVLTVLLAIERATGGWGVGMTFFSMQIMPEGNPLLQVLLYWVPMFTVAMVSVAMGAVFRRWGQFGVWAVGLSTLVVGGVVVVVLTWNDAWPAFGRFFVETPTPLLLAGYPLVIAAVALVGGFLVARRARP